MINNTIRNSAIDSTKAISYQMLIALEEAYSIKPKGKMWIEKFGDVTTSQGLQIEVKKLQHPLTNNDKAFWNTIKNWLDPSFNHEFYQSLLLSTTQTIGPKSIFEQWASLNDKERFSNLEGIWRDSENRFTRKQVKNQNHKPSKVLIIQREIFSNDAKKLKEIIPKIVIASNQPNFEDKWDEMINKHAKQLPSENRENFISSLIGFLMSPKTGWEIEESKFTEEVQKLDILYQNGKHKFPRIKIDENLEYETYHEKLFVKKINEISHQEILTEAIKDYVFANTLILKEIKKYNISCENYSEYKNQLKRIHNARYREKCGELILNVHHDEIISSKLFYDSLMGENPPQLYPYHNTPIDFRNGIYHILADDENDDIHWKLKR